MRATAYVQIVLHIIEFATVASRADSPLLRLSFVILEGHMRDTAYVQIFPHFSELDTGARFARAPCATQRPDDPCAPRGRSLPGENPTSDHTHEGPASLGRPPDTQPSDNGGAAGGERYKGKTRTRSRTLWPLTPSDEPQKSPTAAPLGERAARQKPHRASTRRLKPRPARSETATTEAVREGYPYEFCGIQPSASFIFCDSRMCRSH